MQKILDIIYSYDHGNMEDAQADIRTLSPVEIVDLIAEFRSNGVGEQPIYKFIKEAFGMEITEQQFMAYERVRQSGVTNMFDVPAVITLADQMESVELDREEVLFIMKNYVELKIKYLKGNK